VCLGNFVEGDPLGDAWADGARCQQAERHRKDIRDSNPRLSANQSFSFAIQRQMIEIRSRSLGVSPNTSAPLPAPPTTTTAPPASKLKWVP
jgi:hypothetical protein